MIIMNPHLDSIRPRTVDSDVLGREGIYLNKPRWTEQCLGEWPGEWPTQTGHVRSIRPGTFYWPKGSL